MLAWPSCGVAGEVWVKAVHVGAVEKNVRVHPANRAAPYEALSAKQITAVDGFMWGIMQPPGGLRAQDELSLYLGKYPANGGAGFLQTGKIAVSKGVLSRCTAERAFSLGTKDDLVFGGVQLKCPGGDPEFGSLVVGLTLKNDSVVDASIDAGDLPNMKLSNNGREYVGL